MALDLIVKEQNVQGLFPFIVEVSSEEQDALHVHVDPCYAHHRAIIHNGHK
jgi:hypothetical protein